MKNFCRAERKIDFLLSIPALFWLSQMQQKIIFLISPSYRMNQRIEQRLKKHDVESRPVRTKHRESVENKIEQKICAAALHKETFSKYKNIHQDQNIVLIATGPSLQLFQPIERAVYIGVNTAFQYDKVKLDYYFTQDYTGMKAHIEELGAYIGNNVKKFYGIPDESMQALSLQIPESIAIAHNATRYYCKDCIYCIERQDCQDYIPFTFPLDISSAPLADYHSVVFPALQFALYTNPKRIFLVGCDCNEMGYFNCQQSSKLEVDVVKFGYCQLKTFADHYYPDTEIISINPVGLKGVFRERPMVPPPLSSPFGFDSTPVVLSADNNYAHFAYVTALSIIENSSPDKNYEIFILTNDMKSENEEKLRSLPRKNITVTVINLAQKYRANIEWSALKINHSHISEAAYYRIMIPRIFSQYKKVIYLDCDVIVLTDIAQMMETELDDYYIAGVQDFGILRKYMKEESNEPGTRFYDHVKDTLNMENPYSYINTGVVLFNVELMVKDNLFSRYMELITQTSHLFRSEDQCLINAACSGKIKNLDWSWNFQWHLSVFYKNIENELPYALYEQYQKAQKDIKIMHYVSNIKPWNSPERYSASYFWEYARKSSHYEKLVFELMRQAHTKKGL